jgi:hypothetical protein
MISPIAKRESRRLGGGSFSIENSLSFSLSCQNGKSIRERVHSKIEVIKYCSCGPPECFYKSSYFVPPVSLTLPIARDWKPQWLSPSKQVPMLHGRSASSSHSGASNWVSPAFNSAGLLPSSRMTSPSLSKPSLIPPSIGVYSGDDSGFSHYGKIAECITMVLGLIITLTIILSIIKFSRFRLTTAAYLREAIFCVVLGVASVAFIFFEGERGREALWRW